jgi:hypothetical protein
MKGGKNKMNPKQYAEKIAGMLHKGSSAGLVKTLAENWNKQNATKVQRGYIDPVCVIDDYAGMKDRNTFSTVHLAQSSGKIFIGERNILRVI